jgi:phage terminase large subunit-like protein
VIDNVVWTDSGLSIAGAGCGLTIVGAGEEQVRKVVADEASRCGEDK